MSKLIVTADVHGSLSSWRIIKNLFSSQQDKLAIAGDLFDTKYGSLSNLDFKPDVIKEELKKFSHDFFYVYGNCDIPSFFPGFETFLQFNFLQKNILLYHGHATLKYSSDIDIVITGHTHYYHLEQKNGKIFMNPGSITYPKNDVPSYGVIDKNSARIIELKTGKSLSSIKL